MAAPKAPVLGAKGAKKEHALDEAIFAAEVKSHLVHEAVRAEANARRSGTAQTKSRGMVSGGRSKPWRQKGTGRARAGTIRAPQFTGGGVAFPPTPRGFEVKVVSLPRGNDPATDPDGGWVHPKELHGLLLGVSRTGLAWDWSGREELVPSAMPPKFPGVNVSRIEKL